MIPLFRPLDESKMANNIVDTLKFLEKATNDSLVKTEITKLESLVIISQDLASNLDIRPLLFKKLFKDHDEKKNNYIEPIELRESENLKTSPSSDELNQKLEKETNIIIKNAEKVAGELISQSYIEAQKIKNEIYEKTEYEIRNRVEKEVSEKVSTLILILDQALGEVVELRAKIIRDAEKDIVSLSFCLAKKIIQQEVNISPEIVLNTLCQALTYLVKCDHVIIRINPVELAKIEECRSQISAEFPATTNLVIQGDDTVGQGGCLIETDFGKIDARIESQLRELTEQFYKQANLQGQTE